MKNILIAIVLIAALIAGYRWLAASDEKEVAQQKQQRETLINAQQQQLMNQAKQLGKQMQSDADNRMKAADSKGE